MRPLSPHIRHKERRGGPRSPAILLYSAVPSGPHSFSLSRRVTADATLDGGDDQRQRRTTGAALSKRRTHRPASAIAPTATGWLASARAGRFPIHPPAAAKQPHPVTNAPGRQFTAYTHALRSRLAIHTRQPRPPSRRDESRTLNPPGLVRKTGPPSKSWAETRAPQERPDLLSAKPHRELRSRVMFSPLDGCVHCAACIGRPRRRPGLLRLPCGRRAPGPAYARFHFVDAIGCR